MSFSCWIYLGTMLVFRILMVCAQACSSAWLLCSCNFVSKQPIHS
jgi:hypothetical protein